MRLEAVPSLLETGLEEWTGLEERRMAMRRLERLPDPGASSLANYRG